MSASCTICPVLFACRLRMYRWSFVAWPMAEECGRLTITHIICISNFICLENGIYRVVFQSCTVIVGLNDHAVLWRCKLSPLNSVNISSCSTVIYGTVVRPIRLWTYEQVRWPQTFARFDPPAICLQCPCKHYEWLRCRNAKNRENLRIKTLSIYKTGWIRYRCN